MYRLILIILFTFFGGLGFCQSNVKNQSPQIKKITEAYPYFTASGVNREISLKEKIMKISFYNERGAIVEIHSYSSDSITSLSRKEIILFNKNDNPIRGDVYDKNDQLIEYWVNILDESGNVIEYQTYNGKNEIVKIQNISYDKNGNKIEEINCRPNGDVDYSIESKYNSKNELTEYQNHSYHGTLTRLLSYDDKGNRVEQIFTNTDGKVRIYTYQYDENKNLTYQKTLIAKENEVRETFYEYVFDEYGNWTTHRIINDNRPTFISERSIEYYD